MASDQAPAVSVLIVAYNSAKFIAACIEAIEQAAMRHRVEVLLVDNGDLSTEALVASRFPHVKIVTSRGNIGFAGGNNLLAAQASADLYLLLNPDMRLEAGAIDALVEASETYPAAAAWGGVSLDTSGKPDTGNAITIPSLGELAKLAFLGRAARTVPSATDLDRDAEVDVLMGGLVMFRKSAWDEVGGLDERFFLYCEEADLFYRLKRKGHSFWRIAAARGVHDAGHGEAFSPRRNLFRVTGTMEFARRHWSAPAVLLAALLIWLAAAERYAAGALLGRQRPRLKFIGAAHRLIVREPMLWVNGYDPGNGMFAQLERAGRSMPT